MKEKKLTINHLPIKEIRALFISYVNEYHGGNQTHCAEDLGISASCVNKFYTGRSNEINKKIIKALNECLVKKIKRKTLVYYTYD